MKQASRTIIFLAVFIFSLQMVSAAWVTLNDFNNSNETQNYALYGDHTNTAWGAGYYEIEPGTAATSWLGRAYSAMQGAHNLTRTDYDEFRIQYQLMGVGGNDAYTWCLGAGYAESKDGFNMPSDAVCQDNGGGGTAGYIRELHQGANNASALTSMVATTKYWFIVKGPNGNGTYNYSWTNDSGTDTPGTVIKNNISKYAYDNTTWNLRITAYANVNNLGAQLLQFQANTVTVPLTYSIKGIISYNTVPVNSCRVLLLNSANTTIANTTTNSTGHYTFSSVTNGSQYILMALLANGTANYSVSSYVNPTMVAD